MPQPNLLAWPERDLTEPADLRVGIRPDAPPVVQIRGAIDIQSAPPLRDELLRVMRRYGPQLALDLAGVTFLDCAGVNMLLAAPPGPARGRMGPDHPGLAQGPANDLASRPAGRVRAQRLVTSWLLSSRGMWAGTRLVRHQRTWPPRFLLDGFRKAAGMAEPWHAGGNGAAMGRYPAFCASWVRQVTWSVSGRRWRRGHSCRWLARASPCPAPAVAIASVDGSSEPQVRDGAA